MDMAMTRGQWSINLRICIVFLYTLNTLIIRCKPACKNQPFECKKSPIIFGLLYHNLLYLY